MTSIVPEASVRDVERAILIGKGVVTAQDVEALRRVCFPVGQEIAEALFDIAHATATADNDPAFADFFAEAIGAYLLRADFPAPERLRALASGLALPTRGEASKWGDEQYRRESAETERQLACASEIAAGEARWAFAHLARGGELSPAERRLLHLLGKKSVKAGYERAA